MTIVQQVIRTKGDIILNPNSDDSKFKYGFERPIDVDTTENVSLIMVYSVNDQLGGDLPIDKTFRIRNSIAGYTAFNVPVDLGTSTVDHTGTVDDLYLTVHKLTIDTISMADTSLLRFIGTATRLGLATEDTWDYYISNAAFMIEYTSSLI